MIYDDYILNKKLRDKMFELKTEKALSSSNKERLLKEQEYQIIKKEYAKNLIKIKKYEKEKEDINEKYKRR